MEHVFPSEIGAPAQRPVTLDDKYALERGRAFMSGVQALVRLPMQQRWRDVRAGLHTAGFISGYRGSPLGGYDQALWGAQAHLDAHHIHFQPGVNEELAATALWGTQQLDLYPQSKRYDGVFGLWYGKGPGLDRCSDVLKHANMAGTSRYGGVVAVVGDDHISKSSSAAHQSDHLFKACGSPVFFPSSAQEILDLGLHAFALSRFSGLWAGMKTIQEVVESSSVVTVDPDRVRIERPQDFEMPPGGLHIRWPDAPLQQEQRLMYDKWYAALAYVRVNRLNYTLWEGPNDRLGIMASGKAFNDTRQALVDLGLDEATCRRMGVRLHKVNVVWPLEATITREFAQGLQEILVVEEKRQIIEYQVKEELYNWRDDVRPNVVGKFSDTYGGEWSRANPSQDWLLRPTADLSPELVARAIAQRLLRLGVPDDVRLGIELHLAVLDAKADSARQQGPSVAERQPWFCSGCPHNTSTRVPEGSRAVAGIGCHYMAAWMDRSTTTFTQMGGEGVTWVGQAPFTTEQHVFANLGDGTYFHSGLLAIRQSIAAGVNITYKILYNDAVAMTGGQRVGERPEGHSVQQIMHSLLAEGVRKLVVVTDEPTKYDGVTLADGVAVYHRDALEAVQLELRATAGCTALIYDQTCATEKRRRRKRGSLAEPTREVVINELVCEGCGDCGQVSNCMSVEPIETEFGRKRRINPDTCNKDWSCVGGFCPSFVTLEGARRKPQASVAPQGRVLEGVQPPAPAIPRAQQAWGIVVAGVGGTGVITMGQLLGMAAHIEGKGVVTQDAAGLAQKGGATWSHIQIAEQPEAIYTTKVDVAKADLLMACDAIVAAQTATLAVVQPQRTWVVLNTHDTPTSAALRNPDWQAPTQPCHRAIAQALGGEAQLLALDAQTLAVQLMGDSIFANPLLLGAAWQLGRIPLEYASLMRAIELNGVQVERNQRAFEWGRRCAHDLAHVQALCHTHNIIHWAKQPGWQELVARRVEFLTAYQSADYAARYSAFVHKVLAAEVAAAPGSTKLTQAVAKGLFKVMAYKDEYEVARLHTDTAFVQQVAQQFEGDYRWVHHLAPPVWLGRSPTAKRAMGPWVRPVLQVLARAKKLRGTWWDPFGYTAERRAERALRDDYQRSIEALLPHLAANRLDAAVALAQIPDMVRGYGHVKARNMQAARARWQVLQQAWQALL